MTLQAAIIGFGEAAQAFAGDFRCSVPVQAYDKLTDHPRTRARKLADYANLRVKACESVREALCGAEIVLCLVTAGEALSTAQAAAEHIQAAALYCDMNSVSPETKSAAALAICGAGARYVDVAIMSPVNPKKLSAPLLLSGGMALDAERQLRSLGFRHTRCVSAKVGDASAIKMIRSVIVKGIEALTAEALLAADAAGVTDEVLMSLDAGERPQSWTDQAGYNLERMMVHGLRRAEEMDEAARTLKALGVDPLLTRGTAIRERQIGVLGLRPEAELTSRLAQLRPRKADTA
jgi:3-hydroxyisobutyrate dehydrogenase-like beta-hydroxyacid dehydrogenase